MFQIKTSSLTESQIDALARKLGGTQTILCAGVVKIHTKQKDEFNFTYSGLFGALCFIIDRKVHETFARLLTLPEGECTFEFQIKSNFTKKLNKMNDHFRYFFHKDSIIGLSFAEYEDASNFERAIERYTKPLSKNEHFTRRRSQFGKPLIFELKENIRWDAYQNMVDMNSCSKQFKRICAEN